MSNSRPVSINLYDMTNGAVSSGTVQYIFRGAIEGNFVHPAGTTSVTVTSGTATTSLLTSAIGNSFPYDLVVTDGLDYSFLLPYGDGGTVNVATLITSTNNPPAQNLYEPQLGSPGTSGHVLSSTTAGVRSWVAQSGGGTWGSITGTLANQTDLQTALNDLSANINTTFNDLETHIETTTAVHGIADTSLLLDTSDIGATVQAYSAKTAAIAALTWAANSIILLTGTATASVQALAAHVVTFIQSASAADARTAIGAGTGNGDLLATNNLSELTATASTTRTNLGLGTLATQSGSFTGSGTLATGGFTLTVPATGTAALLATANVFTANQTVSGANLTISGSGNLISRWLTETASRVEIRQVQDVYNNIQLLGAASISTNASRLPLLKALTVTQATDSIFAINDAVTNAIGNIATLNHNSTGTPAAGLGAALNFTLETSTTVDTQAGRMAVLWETVTHASRVPDMVAYLTDSAAEREVWRGRATGSAAAIGFLGATPVARAAHIADASGDDAATVNAILVVLENLGFIATS